MGGNRVGDINEDRFLIPRHGYYQFKIGFAILVADPAHHLLEQSMVDVNRLQNLAVWIEPTVGMNPRRFLDVFACDAVEQEKHTGI